MAVFVIVYYFVFGAGSADTLAPVTDRQSERLRLLVAARLGRIRLIDNITV